MSQNCGDDRGEESGPCLRSLQPSERQRHVHEPLCWKMSNNPNEEILRECHKVLRAVASTEVMKAGGLHMKKAAQKFSEMATKCSQPTACVSGPVQVGPVSMALPVFEAVHACVHSGPRWKNLLCVTGRQGVCPSNPGDLRSRRFYFPRVF